MYFDAAQPALLYLVPAVLIASLTVGIFRGEVGRLFRYSDDEYTGESASGKRRYSVTVAPDVPGGTGGPVDDALPVDEEHERVASGPSVADSATPAVASTESSASAVDSGARRRSTRRREA